MTRPNKPAPTHGSVGDFIPPMPTTFSVSTAEVAGILTPPEPIRTPIEDAADSTLAKIATAASEGAERVNRAIGSPVTVKPTDFKLLEALRRSGAIRAGCYKIR